jgi:hypothetical protein
MIHAEASTRINRPVAEVLEYVTDPTNEPNWHLSCVASPLAGTPHSWRIFGGVSKAGEKRLC